MREGKYESSEHGGTVGTGITFLLIGLGAGALIGMMFAPKAGKQMRKELRRRLLSAKPAITVKGSRVMEPFRRRRHSTRHTP